MSWCGQARVVAVTAIVGQKEFQVVPEEVLRDGGLRLPIQDAGRLCRLVIDKVYRAEQSPPNEIFQPRVANRLCETRDGEELHGLPRGRSMVASSPNQLGFCGCPTEMPKENQKRSQNGLMFAS